MNNQRLEFLDSLRGLAAISVVIFHIINAHWAYSITSKISLIFFNGSDAVSFFFVLSGLVLSFKYIYNQTNIPNINYLSFVLKRIFRLYPLYIVVLTILIFYQNKFQLNSIQFYFDLFSNKFHSLEQLLLTRGYLDPLITPAWTLGVELFISLLLPIFIIVLRVNKTMFYCLIPLVLFGNKFFISIFVFHFLLGIILSENYDLISQAKSNHLKKYRFWILILSLFLFSWRPIFNIFSLPKWFDDFLIKTIYLDVFFISGLGAFGLIAFVISSERIKILLENKFLIFIGKISFSIYLSHWIFTTIFMDQFLFFQNLVGSSFIFFTMMSFVLGLTLITSIVFYNTIERPFIKWSNSVININNNLSLV